MNYVSTLTPLYGMEYSVFLLYGWILCIKVGAASDKITRWNSAPQEQVDSINKINI